MNKKTLRKWDAFIVNLIASRTNLADKIVT
jgi:hypothetical protein